ncbi:MAG: phosphoheptose isomerase [Verrucomicrobiota bacterium]
MDQCRPWGGFYAINETHAREFCSAFFPELVFQEEQINGSISPKILIVEPHKKLSWQYHHRRSELWRSMGGDVGVVTSDTDEQNDPVILKEQEVLQLAQGERHRLIGLETWGVVAEIWQHTDPAVPSDEDDIVRLEDDFGR